LLLDFTGFAGLWLAFWARKCQSVYNLFLTDQNSEKRADDYLAQVFVAVGKV